MNPLPQRTRSAAWVRGIAELFVNEGLLVQALQLQAVFWPLEIIFKESLLSHH